MYSYMRIARKMALRSKARYRLGACLVKSGRVIGAGVNQYGGTNWLAKRYFLWPTIHAEVAAISALSPKAIRGSIIYIYRVKKLGACGLAKPCPSCQDVLRDLKVKRVYYSTNTSNIFGVMVF